MKKEKPLEAKMARWEACYSESVSGVKADIVMALI